jgi:peptidoglycan/LPS O-acetylase OafA/YrhL
MSQSAPIPTADVSALLPAPAPVATTKSEHIASLDGIRAVSIAIVFVSHAGFGDRVPGGFGVTVFFFLSGFLICTLLRREFARTGHVNLRNFFLRRALRIFPPMYSVLLVVSVLTALGLFPKAQFSWNGTLAQAFHITNYYEIAGGPGIAPGLGVFWSLAVEEHFYLVFPLVFPLLMRLATAQRRALVLSCACLLVFAWRCLLVYGFHVSTERTYYASDTRMDAILWGCVLALFCNPVEDPMLPLSRRGVWGLLGASLAVLVGTLVFRDEGFRETTRYTIQSMALLPLFYLAISQPSLLAFRWLNSSWLSYVGRLSYAIYLVHFVVFEAFRAHFPELLSWRLLLAGAVLSFGLGAAIHRGLEKPFARLRRRLHG